MTVEKEGQMTLEPGRAVAITNALARKEARDTILSCLRCDALAPTGTAPVPFRGPTPNQVMVLGEAPGRTEDTQGQPFVGPSGAVIERVFREHGMKLDHCFVTNVVCCFPDGSPSHKQVRACLGNLRAQVALCQPHWVLALGASALSVCTSAKVTAVHGHPFQATMGPLVGRMIWPSFHPAAGLRSPTVMRVLEMDLASFVGVAKGEVDWRVYSRG